MKSSYIFLLVLALPLLGAGCSTIKDTVKDVKTVGTEVQEVSKDAVDLAKTAKSKADDLSDIAKDVARTAKTASEKVGTVLGDDSAPLLVLEDFTGGDSTGTVGNTVVENVYTLALFATMPAPEAGKHYEAWLVRTSDGYFVNMGTMSAEEAGLYYHTFTSATDYSDYHKVKVTLETDGGDEYAEEMILVGVFE